MGELRRNYTEEFKRNAIGLVRSTGRSAAAVSRDLGLTKTVLSRWLREEAEETSGKKAFTGQGIPRDEELDRLRRENLELREANEILKKAVAIFSVK